MIKNQDFDIDIIKKRLLRKYPAFGRTINNVKYQIVDKNSGVQTASTDGKTIFVNKTFMQNLTEDQQTFVFAHEVCHIALNHILRSKDKDPKIWNFATDAVINQFLKKDGLEILDGAIDIKDALNFDAEELYQKLKEKQDKEQQKNEQNNSNQNEQQDDSQQNGDKSENNNSQNNKDSQSDQSAQGDKNESNQMNNGNKNQNSSDKSEQGESKKTQQNESEQMGHDSHAMWENAVKQFEKEAKENKKQKKNKSKQTNSKNNEHEQSQKISEKEVFKNNEQERVRKAEEIMNKINSKVCGDGGNSLLASVGNVGKAEPITNWKKLLRKSIEKEDEAWGHKFSDKGNNYCARIEDVEIDEETETEIILDTSGSVSESLLKNFLKQVKNILKNSKIKVGTFASDFYGFQEIKREKDIDNLKLNIGGGTNFDAASRAFSKRKEVNKICFTDGEDCGDAHIKEKRKDIIWISFENKDFKPDFGKVIYVDPKLIKFKDDEEYTK